MAASVDRHDPFEQALDSALEMTFPASDPIAPAIPRRDLDSMAGKTAPPSLEPAGDDPFAHCWKQSFSSLRLLLPAALPI